MSHFNCQTLTAKFFTAKMTTFYHIFLFVTLKLRNTFSSGSLYLCEFLDKIGLKLVRDCTKTKLTKYESLSVLELLDCSEDETVKFPLTEPPQDYFEYTGLFWKQFGASWVWCNDGRNFL